MNTSSQFIRESGSLLSDEIKRKSRLDSLTTLNWRDIRNIDMPLRAITDSSVRDRIWQVIKNGRDLVKLELRIIGISTFLFFVVTVVNLLTHDSSTLKNLLPIALIGMVALIVLLTTISCLAIALRDRNREIASLNRRVRQVYSKALDGNSFNPHKVERHHEQSRPRTRQ